MKCVNIWVQNSVVNLSNFWLMFHNKYLVVGAQLIQLAQRLLAWPYMLKTCLFFFFHLHPVVICKSLRLVLLFVLPWNVCCCFFFFTFLKHKNTHASRTNDSRSGRHLSSVTSVIMFCHRPLTLKSPASKMEVGCDQYLVLIQSLRSGSKQVLIVTYRWIHPGWFEFFCTKLHSLIRCLT